MSNTKATFKPPFLLAVSKAVDKAYSICWEGCHKIYINFDAETDAEMREIGYDTIPVGDTDIEKEEAIDTLFDWWESSCGLRFINGISHRNKFSDVITQFAYAEEDDDG